LHFELETAKVIVEGLGKWLMPTIFQEINQIITVFAFGNIAQGVYV
jgi:hypothetical protein